jgi:cell wall-associated NlpC family hydrolase
MTPRHFHWNFRAMSRNVRGKLPALSELRGRTVRGVSVALASKPLMRPGLLFIAVALSATIGSGCASAPTVLAGPAPFPGAAAAPVEAASPRTAVLVNDILDTALAQRGAPYRLGGSEPQGGFDCSGLVQYVFARNHVELPRTVVQQYRAGRRVKRDEVRRGDLVFFGPSGRPPTHVGIALDSGTFVHAPDTGAVVRVERLDADYWKKRFAGAKRVI